MDNKVTQMRQGTIGVATVVDAHPRFWCELALWAICARDHLPGPKRVYAVGDLPAGLAAFLDKAGIELRPAARLMAHSPHCNKLIPFLDPDGFEDQIVTDCDVFATGDFSRFFRQDQVRLPPNNHGVPPLEVFARVFAEAGLECDPEPGLSIFAGGEKNMETFAGNVSAGVICVPLGLRSFCETWHARAAWFEQRLELLGRYKGHVDQISFAVAAAQTRVPFSHFPAQANAVLQLLPHIQSLYALHLTSGHIPQYRNWFNANGHLQTHALPVTLHNTIAAFNDRVDIAMGVLADIPETAMFRENFLNPDYRR